MGPKAHLLRLERAIERWEIALLHKVFGPERSELLDALRRECDANRTVLSRSRTLVPNAFTVELNPDTYDRLEPCLDELCHQLTDVLLQHAQRRGFEFPGPLAVRLEKAEALGGKRFRVTSTPAQNLRSGEVGGVVDAASRPRRRRYGAPVTR